MASVPNTTTSVSPHPQSLSIAIVGGGIGGLALALGLLKHPHIDFHIFESAPSFGEIGAGVAFGPNAQRALELLGPEARDAYLAHATPNMWPSHGNTFIDYIVGQGEQESQLVISSKNATGMQSVHRAHFLDELVKSVPAKRAHFNKRLESIEDIRGKPVVLRFKDGTTASADAIIGCDGLHSHVREYLLGKDAAQPVFAGSVAYRGLVPMDAAVEKIGAEYAQNSKMLVGPGRAILSYPIDHGEIFNIVVMEFGRDRWEHEKSIVPAKHEVLERLFDGWGETSRHMIELLDTPDLAAWKMSEAPVAPFYNTNRVAMMGDAAHATLPYQGQGAGQAIEDALVLSTLLGKITNSNRIPAAFSAYDQVRRPRSQRIVRTSHEMGDLVGMMREGTGTDVGKMRKDMKTWMHWIWHRDLVEQNREALKLFEESL